MLTEQWLCNSLKVDEIKHFLLPYDSQKMDAYPISKDFMKKSPKDASVIEPAA
jgi:putative SOS response-associated peptidase YedK